MLNQCRVVLAGSFAQLARAADKARDTMLVPKTALETPPLEIRTLGADELRQSARRIGKVNDECGSWPETCCAACTPPRASVWRHLRWVSPAAAGD